MTKLSADYLAALRLLVEGGLEPGLQAAANLGATADKLRLSSLELARIHHAALTAILTIPTFAKDEGFRILRASFFFNEALTPIEKTHRSALESKAELCGTHKNLSQTLEDLLVSQRQMVRQIEELKSAGDALRTSEETAAYLLVESRTMEEALLAVTRRNLSADETERKQMSLRLQDDIAQAMLGIHVRLSALKVAVSVSHEDLAGQITSAERLMAESIESIARFASSFDTDREN
ncbi:MAG: signal transduction histidine kinase [Verrucomicrobiales bacterium]|jgi:signal transduction histidine kinase